MIAVATKFKKHPATKDVIAVPAVVRLYAFVSIIICFFSVESVMFYVVYRFK